MADMEQPPADSLSQTLLVAVYDDISPAEQDYFAIGDVYNGWNLPDTYDAALLTKDANGKTYLLHRTEHPRREGAVLGTGIGLATGLVVALFPPALTAGLIAAATGGGAAIGALAGHIVGGLTRGEIKELGESLDNSHSGLLIVCDTRHLDEVRGAITGTQAVTQRTLTGTHQELKPLIADATQEAEQHPPLSS